MFVALCRVSRFSHIIKVTDHLNFVAVGACTTLTNIAAQRLEKPLNLNLYRDWVTDHV
jgi:hypothetical protein